MTLSNIRPVPQRTQSEVVAAAASQVAAADSTNTITTSLSSRHRSRLSRRRLTGARLWPT